MGTEVQVSKIKLRHARAELGLTQAQLAQRADISEKTLVSAEQGKTIRALNAAAILKALNTERAKQNMPPLNFTGIEWSIQGD